MEGPLLAQNSNRSPKNQKPKNRGRRCDHHQEKSSTVHSVSDGTDRNRRWPGAPPDKLVLSPWWPLVDLVPSSRPWSTYDQHD